MSQQTITSACVLVINSEGLVLSVSRKDDPTDFGLPGGKREPGESPIETAIRETWEEARVKLYPEHLAFVFEGLGRKYYCATYLATKYDDSEMCSSEEGVVKWLDYADVLPGTFKAYNKRLLREIFRVLGNHQLIAQRDTTTP